MSRLPTPGGDQGSWGAILNDFLEVSLAADGTINNNAVGTAQIQAGAVTNTQLDNATQTALGKASTAVQLGGDLGGSINVPTVAKLHGVALDSAAPSSGQVLGYNGSEWIASTVSSTTVSDATTGAKGIVQLAGDLSGTAASPTVAKINSIALPGSAPSNGQVLTATSSSATSWSTPAASGAQALAATAIQASAYSANPGDFIPVDASGANVTITLPTAPADKTRVGIKLINVSGSNKATITRGGSTDVFNKSGGSTSLTLSLLNQGVLLQYNSATGVWYVQSDDLALSQLDGRYSGNLAIDVSRTPYNVSPSNSPGGETGIQAAIDQANANAAAGSGPTEVFVPAGTYVVDIHVIPGQTTIAAAIWMRSNVTLKFAPGAVLQLKNNASLPGGVTQAHIVSVVTPYDNSANLSSLKHNVTLDGLVVDANGNNQVAQGSGAPMISHGIFLGLVQDGWVMRCKVQGLNGTGGSPPNETMHFECNHSVGIRYVACEVDGSTATDTASGFSIDNSFDISYTLCTAHDLSHGQGFTCWQSSGIRYATCQSYNNAAGSGFNNERSTDVTFAGCISGGYSPSIESPSAQLPQFSGGQIMLGNKYGWTVSGGTDIILSGCQATNNNVYGLHFYTSSDGPNSPTDNLTCTRCYAIGGSFFNNTTANITIDTGQVDTYALWAKANANADYLTVQGNAPNLHFPTGSSGKRETVSGYGSWASRWILGSITGRLAGNAVMGIDSNGVLSTSGYAANRRAVTTSTSITASDEIIAVGSISSPVTLTLPSAASLAAGTRFVIKDEGGGAATNNITIATTSSQTIDGAATQVITSNYGMVALYSDGANWKLTAIPSAAGMLASTYDPAAISQQVVGTTAAQTVSGKRITRRVVNVTQSATPAIATDATDIASITGLAQAITSMTTSLTGTPNDGDKLEVRITDNGTIRTITWGASFQSTTVTLPTATVASTILRVGFEWNIAASKWDCIAVA